MAQADARRRELRQREEGDAQAEDPPSPEPVRGGPSDELGCGVAEQEGGLDEACFVIEACYFF